MDSEFNENIIDINLLNNSPKLINVSEFSPFIES